jgi:hypothetical protein
MMYSNSSRVLLRLQLALAKLQQRKDRNFTLALKPDTIRCERCLLFAEHPGVRGGRGGGHVHVIPDLSRRVWQDQNRRPESKAIISVQIFKIST